MATFKRLAWSWSNGNGDPGRTPRDPKQTTAPVVLDRRVLRGCTIVTLAGDLDIEAVSVLDRALVRMAAATEPHIVADLGLVDFMDCSALGAFDRAAREASTAGGCLRLVNADQKAYRLLQTSELDRVVCLSATLDAATGSTCEGRRHTSRPAK